MSFGNRQYKGRISAAWALSTGQRIFATNINYFFKDQPLRFHRTIYQSRCFSGR